MKYILVFTIALFSSLVLTFIVKEIMLKLRVVDKPDEQRWNKRTVPLMGGIAIFTSFLITTLFNIELNSQINVVLIGAGVIFLIGVFDDLFGTYPLIKFAVQLIVAVGFVVFTNPIKILPYMWLNQFLTVFWIVGITNAFNLIDNMDGLSSSITVIAAFSLFIFSLVKGQTCVGLMCLALVGSCLGFLRYNFNPAQIFMGDCGSMFLGYILATLTILGNWENDSQPLVSSIFPIFILGVAIFDTTLVTILRLIHGKKPWHGGRDHSSHRLAKMFGGNEMKAVIILYGIGIILGGTGLASVIINSSLVLIWVALMAGVSISFLGYTLSKIDCYTR